MKRLAIWTALAAAAWGAVVGLAMCAREALAQSPIPDSLTNAGLKGFDDGGYKAVAVVALAGCMATGSLALWLIKTLVAHMQAGAAIALEQAKADVLTGARLTAIENFLRAKGMP